jgi:hypothetical protein
MTIAQALKQKNKLISEIQKIWQKIYKYNSIHEGSERPYSTEKLWSDYITASLELVELKTKIHEASSPVRLKIFRLSELKSAVEKVKNITTDSGVSYERYSANQMVLTSELNVLWKDSQIDHLEKEIESLQEELDKFNHLTQI